MMPFAISRGKFSGASGTNINTDSCKHQSPYEPEGAIPGDLWYKNDTGQIYVLI